MWPTNSPDLNPVDYSIWSVLQKKVYRSRIANVDELKTHLIDEWARFDQSIVDAACYRPVASSSQHLCPCERSTLQAQILTVATIYFHLNFWLLNWWQFEEV